MYCKTLTTLVLVCCFLAWGVSPVQAAPLPIIDGSIDGSIDSGWTIEFTGATTGVSISDVDLFAEIKTVTITITKDFAPPENIFGDIIPRVGGVVFNEEIPNLGLLDRIIIASEVIVNNTGTDWEYFKWELVPLPTGIAAEFNLSESFVWNVDTEFGILTKSPLEFLASKGSGDGVLDTATFEPDGQMVIDINQGATDQNITISLKQHHELPEPATMSLLLVGGIAVLSRRFQKR